MRWYGTEGEGRRRAVTMGFMTLALAQILHALNARSQRRSAFPRPFTNAWRLRAVLACLILQIAAAYWSVLQPLLRTVPLTAMELVVVVVCSLAPVAVVEMVKLLRSSRRGEA